MAITYAAEFTSIAEGIVGPSLSASFNKPLNNFTAQPAVQEANRNLASIGREKDKMAAAYGQDIKQSGDQMNSLPGMKPSDTVINMNFAASPQQAPAEGGGASYFKDLLDPMASYTDAGNETWVHGGYSAAQFAPAAMGLQQPPANNFALSQMAGERKDAISADKAGEEIMKKRVDELGAGQKGLEQQRASAQEYAQKNAIGIDGAMKSGPAGPTHIPAAPGMGM